MNVFDEMLVDWDESKWMKLSSNHVAQCVGGRLSNALGYKYLLPEVSERPEWQHLASIIREQDRSWPDISVQQWNDMPWTTFKDVVEIVKLASVRWDANQPNPAPLVSAEA